MFTEAFKTITEELDEKKVIEEIGIETDEMVG